MWILKKRNVIYSRWIRNYFAKCEADIMLYPPITLIGGKYIIIGHGFVSFKGLRLECYDSYGDQKFKPTLVIGDNVIFNYNVHIGCINEVKIGNNVLFASNVYVSDHFHGNLNASDFRVRPALRPLTTKGSVVIRG